MPESHESRCCKVQAEETGREGQIVYNKAMVPIVPGMRSSNSSSNPARRRRADDDSSGSSSSALDSMRPVAPPPRKRRRRTIVDAFSSISLMGRKRRVGGAGTNANNSRGAASAVAAAEAGSAEDDNDLDEDADSSQAVADMAEDVEVGYSTTSSLEDDYEEEDETNHSCNNEGEKLLSDKQEVERKVMFELVFGPNSEFALPKHPVDVKLQQLIRKSLHEAATGTGPSGVSKDDMAIDAAYSRRSDEASLSSGSTLRTNLTRSSSLPNISIMDEISEGGEEDGGIMDTSAT